MQNTKNDKYLAYIGIHMSKSSHFFVCSNSGLESGERLSVARQIRLTCIRDTRRGLLVDTAKVRVKLSDIWVGNIIVLRQIGPLVRIVHRLSVT